MHDLNTILPLLINMALHYPQACRTPAQLQILAEDYAEDLADYSMPVVEQAFRRHRKTSAYFPTVADIRRQCALVQHEQEMLKERFALPASVRTVDEQAELNLANLVRIRTLFEHRGKRPVCADTPVETQIEKLHVWEATQ